MDVKEWARFQEILLKSQLRAVREILREGDIPPRKPRRKGRSQRSRRPVFHHSTVRAKPLTSFSTTISLSFSASLLPSTAAPESMPPAGRAGSRPPGPERHKVRRAACWTEVRRLSYHDLERHLPFVTVAAAKPAHSHLVTAAFNPDRFPVYQCVGRLLPGCDQYSGEGGA